MTATNRDHLDQWRDHPWWPAINHAYRAIKRVPGSQIVSIHSTPGQQLGIFWSVPNDGHTVNEYEYREASYAVSYAEGWVDGYQRALQPRAIWINNPVDPDAPTEPL